MYTQLLALLPLTVAEAASGGWHAGSIGESVLAMAIFALAGIILAIVGYKLFDYCTPGDLHEEIVKHRNVAAAVIGAAVIVGVCIVVAAAIMG
jgi:putative membrane protein